MSESTISRYITNASFLFSIGIVGISVISVIFPALIISQTYEFPLNLNPFETSPWVLPIILSTVSFLVFGFMHYKKKLPSLVSNSINQILKTTKPLLQEIYRTIFGQETESKFC